jgi:ubiquitin carboxyl-terminal hydrolase 44/49
MWSGKWAVVTPHAVLNAVWRLVPAFRGYSQQDAQEFLCEALEQLQSELRLWPPGLLVQLSQPFRNVAVPSEILPSLFEGQLASLVTYKTCRHSSRKVEPFCDLSLDFPEIYQADERKPQQKHQTLQSCSLAELLEKFTECEMLTEEIFSCGQCATGEVVPLVRVCY